MKILMLMNHFVVVKMREELIMELLSQGNEMVISTTNDNDNYFTSKGCRIVPIQMNRHGTNPIADIKLIYSYIQLVRKEQPDIVLTYTIKPNIYGGMACQLTKTRYLANITGLGSAVENGGLLSKLTTMLYKIGLLKCDCIFFQNSENMAYFQRSKIHGKHARLIPGSGVNIARFKPQHYPDEDIVHFVFVARVMKEKGIDQYLYAAKIIRDRYSNTAFHICGFCEESYEEMLRELTEQGVIIYHGMVSDIKEIYRKTHCTVHPTYYPEGLSNVLLESCAVARPIITTDRSGCREVVDDGINGFVVQQKDGDDLVRKIEKFLKLSHEEKVQMGLNGRAKAEREFDRELVINAYMEEIKPYE